MHLALRWSPLPLRERVRVRGSSNEVAWINITCGHSGLMAAEKMHTHARPFWDDYDAGKIDDERARLRLALVRPSVIVAVPRR